MPRENDKRDMLVVTISVVAAVVVIAAWWAGYLPILDVALQWLANAGQPGHV